MSVRVVARLRPRTRNEAEKDSIVMVDPRGESVDKTIVKIPNPKNEAELYSFKFNSVYDSCATQQQVFENEVFPTVKHLFGGFDVTIFAYGVTGTGKTHTMRGGKSLADRGAIPRMLSAIYRRARKIEKDSAGATQVEVAMSYYEIYNDKVFDLFEPPEKRSPAGLPIRDNAGKTVVVGLTEKPCETLKEFECLYDAANVNRSTSATKLNAHSSRSHAILCVTLKQTSETKTIISKASAIDLAGSEDNRRTDNNRERLVESSAINKSLFVLAQCVEAISKGQSRIPYRESKMTRILSLGQNNGLTVMILNLAPGRNFHLDTLSSLNFANRTKKIEVNEIENEPIFRGSSTAIKPTVISVSGSVIQRQPLRSISVSAHNTQVGHAERSNKPDRPAKSFSVFADKRKSQEGNALFTASRTTGSAKRSLEDGAAPTRPAKASRYNDPRHQSSRDAVHSVTQKSLDDLICRRIDERLAEKALEAAAHPAAALSVDLQKRLDVLERRVADKDDESGSEGLQYLLMAKQHAARGEDASALRMYKLAQPFFPGNSKLEAKISGIIDKLQVEKKSVTSCATLPAKAKVSGGGKTNKMQNNNFKDDARDSDYQDSSDGDFSSGDEESIKPKVKSASVPRTTLRRPAQPVFTHIPARTDVAALSAVPNLDLEHNVTHSSGTTRSLESCPTPRTAHLLSVINTRDISRIKSLRGVGSKRAEAIVSALVDLDAEDVTDLSQLGALRGVGLKTVENMRSGVSVV